MCPGDNSAPVGRERNHRGTPYTKINDTVKFTDQQQAILNGAVEQLMEAGGLTALTQAHFNEAMKIVAQRFISAALQGELEHHLTREYENLNE